MLCVCTGRRAYRRMEKQEIKHTLDLKEDHFWVEREAKMEERESK